MLRPLLCPIALSFVVSSCCVLLLRNVHSLCDNLLSPSSVFLCSSPLMCIFSVQYPLAVSLSCVTLLYLLAFVPLLYLLAVSSCCFFLLCHLTVSSYCILFMCPLSVFLCSSSLMCPFAMPPCCVHLICDLAVPSLSAHPGRSPPAPSSI